HAALPIFAGPYLLYVGRIGVSKGSRDLFTHYERWRASDPAHDVSLVLIGDAEIGIPKISGIVHLGRLSEQEKWDALAGCAAFVMPSLLESLSLVTLEAWAAGRPEIVDARPRVVSARHPGAVARGRAGDSRRALAGARGHDPPRRCGARLPNVGRVR